MAEKENKLLDLKKFFEKPGEKMTSAQFSAEWNQLSETEKDWFRKQPLE